MVQGELDLQHPSDEVLAIVFSGNWKLTSDLPCADEVRKVLDEVPTIQTIECAAGELAAWDSGLLVFLNQLRGICTERKISIDSSALPEGVRKLLALAAVVPEKKAAVRVEKRVPFFLHLGNETVEFFQSLSEMLTFIGEMVLSVLRWIQGKACFRRADLWLTMETCGIQALPIVTLICFLVGLILAFIGAIQLELFGAEIYVADLVGIGMVRLMAAVMTGVVMAGRTGGAFAAQLGAMRVNQEIDALITFGIAPMDFLVLPRMLALALMMPLLCLYANIMGILGGMVVGVGILKISLVQYYTETIMAVNLWHFGIGLFSGTVFGVIVALSGCMRGMQCGRSASAVGDAATSAVVTAIVGIVVATALITIICDLLGI